MTDQPQYFAIPDPLDPGKVSYWYQVDKGRDVGKLKPWPPRRSRWGRLREADVPFSRTLTPGEYREFVNAHFAKVAAVRGQAKTAIAQDPAAASARFAALTTRCCYCGKALSDQRSKVYGIGPDCRTDVAPAVLAAAMEAVRAAHGEALAR